MWEHVWESFMVSFFIVLVIFIVAMLGILMREVLLFRIGVPVFLTLWGVVFYLYRKNNA